MPQEPFLPASQGSPQASLPPASKGPRRPGLAREHTRHGAQKQLGKPGTCTTKEIPGRQASCCPRGNPAQKALPKRSPFQGAACCYARFQADPSAGTRCIWKLRHIFVNWMGGRISTTPLPKGPQSVSLGVMECSPTGKAPRTRGTAYANYFRKLYLGHEKNLTCNPNYLQLNSNYL